jgi:phosphotransferase system HPr-like phosphotransfer protein
MVDAKSIMGIFSLDLGKPVEVTVHGTLEQADEYKIKINKFIL